MENVVSSLDQEVQQRHLLNHPFYQRWSAGELSRPELEEYARQYYHYALAFPTFLSGMHAHTEDMVIRQHLLENLIEEERGPENHPELWLRFCEALSLDRADVASGTPNAATRALIDSMRTFARSESLHEGLAALYAYESQIPAVAKAKIDGLAAWYGYQLCLLNRTLTTPGLEINLAWLYASAVVGGALIAVYGFAMMISPPPQGDPLH